MIPSRFFQGYRLFRSTISIARDVSSSSSSSDIDFIIEDKKKYVLLKLNKEPTNSLNVEYLDKLITLVDDIEESPGVHGVILTSNLPNIFSSGLDLNEICRPNLERLALFWRLVQEFWIKLYGSKKVYIAAINGHAPAAGCQIAMSCDYRIMAKGKYTIGIGAVRFGVEPPFWFRDTMINTIGHRETEKALQKGHLFDPEEAFRVKLVDELVEKENLIARAEEEMQKWLLIPANARELTKRMMRQETIDRLLRKRDRDVEYFIEMNTHKNVQESIENYLDELKNKKKTSKK